MRKEQITRLAEATFPKRFAQLLSSLIKGEHALLTCVTAIAVIAVVTIWFSINQAQSAFLKMHATENAHAWASVLTNEIDQLPNILEGRPLKANEEKQLKFASRLNEVFQYKIYDSKGLIVYSNIGSDIGKQINNPNFTGTVAKGYVFTELKYKHKGHPAEHHNAHAGHMVYSAAIVPIMVNGKFAGAIEVHVDETRRLLELRVWSDRGFLFLVVLLALLGTMIAFAVRRDIVKLRTREDQLNTSVQSEKHANEELKKSQFKLIEAEQLATVGRVTATVSHEIRNPLGAIRNSLYMIEKKAAAANLDLHHLIERAERSVARCDSIIGDLLEYTRTNKVKMVAVDSTEYLNELLDEQALPGTITLTRDLPVPGQRIVIDLDRFRRAIINLVVNAAQAIKESGAECGEISVSCRPHGEGSVISVQDNGPGIPEDLLARISEPLFTTKSFGVGLGLPTTEKVVEQHGGELRIDTQVGVGTTFSILLPSARFALANEEQTHREEKAA